MKISLQLELRVERLVIAWREDREEENNPEVLLGVFEAVGKSNTKEEQHDVRLTDYLVIWSRFELPYLHYATNLLSIPLQNPSCY